MRIVDEVYDDERQVGSTSVSCTSFYRISIHLARTWIRSTKTVKL